LICLRDKFFHYLKELTVDLELTLTNSLSSDMAMCFGSMKKSDACCFIQRIWRGCSVRETLPKLRKHQVANLNAGHHLDTREINSNGFWSLRPSCIPEIHNIRKLTFDTTISFRTKDDESSTEDTDFVERGQRPLCKALKIVEASIEGRPIYPIFAGKKDVSPSSIDAIMVDIMDTLKQGEVYKFPNHTSAKLQPTPAAIKSISESIVKFRFFTGLDHKNMIPFPEIKTVLSQPTKCTVRPLLARQAPRSVFCLYKGPAVEEPSIEEPSVEDYEAKLQKISQLPYAS